MTTRNNSMGTRTIQDVHESAILLWIAAKDRDPQSNPAHGIYFALTNETWPSGVSEVSNAIDLCNVLNESMGKPRLTEDQMRDLCIKAMALFEVHKSGRSPFQLFGYLTWANRLAYFMGAVSLILSGLSLWIVGLILATWWCFGAAQTAAAWMSMGKSRPAWEFPIIASLHIVALIALVVAALLHIHQ